MSKPRPQVRESLGILMTQDEVAAHFGVSRSAIYNAEQRAIRKIREAIETEAAGRGMSVREWLWEATA